MTELKPCVKVQKMKVYLVELPNGSYSYCDDYAMVVVAEDEKHAERKARWSSNSFKKQRRLMYRK